MTLSLLAAPSGAPAFAPRPLTLASAGVAMALVLVAAVAVPLATYTVALAMFGLAHVVSELRYVDHRFGARLRGGLWIWIVVPVGLAVLVRIASIAGVLQPHTAAVLELALGAALLAGPLRVMQGRRPWVVLVAALLAAGAVLAPFETLLALAIAHNFTPLAFLADALRGNARRTVLALASIPFVWLPLLIASGLPYEWLADTRLFEPDATPFASGPLDLNIGVYVPRGLVSEDAALHLFSAAVFAQCMHYAAVILVLPRLIGPAARPLVKWPRPALFAGYAAAAAAILLAGFAVDFQVARQVYALPALVHAWIEIPILLLALDRSQSGSTM
jgi:hypothetical protein